MAAQLTNYAGVLGRPIPFSLGRFTDAWRMYRLYRATEAELRKLSIRDREDIGLAGEDISEVARRAVYKA